MIDPEHARSEMGEAWYQHVREAATHEYRVNPEYARERTLTEFVKDRVVEEFVRHREASKRWNQL